MRIYVTLILVLALSLAAWPFGPPAARAENWPQFRGPNFNGSTNEKNLPVKWTRTQNVLWSAELPGPSAATPVVWGDRVFVSSTNTARETLDAICLDRKTGKQLWSRQPARGLRKDSRSYFASPSPVTDGERVIFFYGEGTLVAYDFNGEQLWKRNIQKDLGQFAFLWTFSTSPLLYDGKLYLQVLQRDVPVRGRGLRNRKNESYLLAMNPKTGKTLWRHVRPSKAQAESREAFTTPIPFEHNGRKEILIAGGDAVSGHDPQTGKELWRWGTWNPRRIGHWRLVPSPVAGKGVVLACAPKGSPVYAVKAGGEGTLTDDALLWVSRDNPIVSADVPTPALNDGDFFVLSDVRKKLSRVDAQSGEVKWSANLPRGPKFESSPLAADGKIYAINFSSEVAVFDAASGDLLSTIAMAEPEDDPVRSSIIAAHGNLFVRTTDKLYCIGAK